MFEPWPRPEPKDVFQPKRGRWFSINSGGSPGSVGFWVCGERAVPRVRSLAEQHRILSSEDLGAVAALGVRLRLKGSGRGAASWDRRVIGMLPSWVRKGCSGVVGGALSGRLAVRGWVALLGVLGLAAVSASSAEARHVAGAAGAPGAPSNVVVKAVSDGQVLLAWRAPSSWGGAKPLKYIIKASHANLKGVSKVVVRATSRTARLNYLYDDVPQTFKVAAENSAKRVGPYSAASARADPSPTVQVTNTLTLSAAPQAKTPCPLGSFATECFSFQQNFFVDRENAGASAPIIWAQNWIIVYKQSGQWWVLPQTNVWEAGKLERLAAGAAGPYEVSSFPFSVTVITAVTPDKLTFRNSMSGSLPFWTWKEPSSLARSHPFSVVFDPGLASVAGTVIGYYTPQAVLVGPAYGYGVSFKSGTAGSLKSVADLRNGASQTGTDCPVKRRHVATAEFGLGLAWMASGSNAGFRFTTAKGTPEGVIFLPQVLPCTGGPPSHGVERPALHIVDTPSPWTPGIAPSLP